MISVFFLTSFFFSSRSFLIFKFQCGVEIAENTPYLVNLQIMVINLPGIQSFIKSDKYFPIGQGDYVQQVSTVLDRAL